MTDVLDSRDFYEICQQYRHAVMGNDEFNALKEWLRSQDFASNLPATPIYKDAA